MGGRLSLHQTKRYGGIDMMKFVMSIFIVLHHFQQITGIYYLKGINFWGGRYYWGRLVECFFIISGMMAAYGLTKLQSGETKMVTYFKHKVLRILPLPALSILVYEFLTFLYQKNGLTFDWVLPTEPSLKGTALSVLGLQSWGLWKDPMINNPMWYISILLLCQILLMFMGKFLKKSVLFYGLCLFFILPFLVYRLRHLGVALPFDHVITGFYSFFYGVILAGLIRKRKIPNLLGLAGILVVAAFIVLLELGVPFILQYEIVFSIYLVFPGLILFFLSDWVNAFLSGKVSDILGAVSFDIYVWHVPILFALYIWDATRDVLMPCLPRRHTVVFVALTVLLAFFSYGVGILIRKLVKEMNSKQA